MYLFISGGWLGKEVPPRTLKQGHALCIATVSSDVTGLDKEKEVIENQLVETLSAVLFLLLRVFFENFCGLCELLFLVIFCDFVDCANFLADCANFLVKKHDLLDKVDKFDR